VHSRIAELPRSLQECGRAELLEGVVYRKGMGVWFAGAYYLRSLPRDESRFPVSPGAWCPRFASRLHGHRQSSFLPGAVWLYQRSTPSTTKQPAAASLRNISFEAPTPMNQDDVLISWRRETMSESSVSRKRPFGWRDIPVGGRLAECLAIVRA